MTVTLDDVNEAPWVEKQNFALDETAPPGILVGAVAATYPDNDGNGVLTYAITSGHRSGRFAIDPASDALIIAQGAAGLPVTLTCP